MNAHRLQRLFPHASKSFLEANISDLNPREAALPQRDPGNGSLGKKQAKAKDTRRFLVVVEMRRRRLLDEDNFFCKYAVDTLRYTGIIPDDNPGQTQIKVSQVKVSAASAEETLISVYEIT